MPWISHPTLSLFSIVMETSVSLLERLRCPHEATAWARFVDLYTPMMLVWARRLGLDDAESGDLLQEVFFALLKKLPSFSYQPGGSFRGWLKTVTLNKHREMRRGPALPCTDSKPLDELADPAEKFWEADYRRHLISRALELAQRDFQPTTWRAFHEVVVAGRNPADVAAELGVTVNAVYVARSRVIRHLRQELEGTLD